MSDDKAVAIVIGIVVIAIFAAITIMVVGAVRAGKSVDHAAFENGYSQEMQQGTCYSTKVWVKTE